MGDENLPQDRKDDSKQPAWLSSLFWLQNCEEMGKSSKNGASDMEY